MTTLQTRKLKSAIDQASKDSVSAKTEARRKKDAKRKDKTGKQAREAGRARSANAIRIAESGSKLGKAVKKVTKKRKK